MAFHYSPKIVRDGSLVLYLDAANAKSFDAGNIWTDISDSNIGTLVNSPTFDPSNGGSLVFNGTNYVQLSTFASVTDFTIEVWFNTTGGIDTYNTIIGSGTTNRLTFNNTAKKLAAYIGTVAFGSPYHISNATVELNTWCCAHYVYDSATTIGQWYVNSVPDSTRTKAISFSSFDVNIGYTADVTNAYFNGRIPRVLIYDRVLSSTEISQNYNAIKPRYGL